MIKRARYEYSSVTWQQGRSTLLTEISFRDHILKACEETGWPKLWESFFFFCLFPFLKICFGILDTHCPTEMHFSWSQQCQGICVTRARFFETTSLERRGVTLLHPLLRLCVYARKMMFNVLLVIPPSPMFKQQPSHPVQPHHFPCPSVSFSQTFFQSHLLEALSNCFLC